MLDIKSIKSEGRKILKYICVFCLTKTSKESSAHPGLCNLCYRLIKKAERDGRLDYLCDG